MNFETKQVLTAIELNELIDIVGKRAKEAEQSLDYYEAREKAGELKSYEREFWGQAQADYNVFTGIYTAIRNAHFVAIF